MAVQLAGQSFLLGPAGLPTKAEVWGTAIGMHWQALDLCCAEADCGALCSCAQASAHSSRDCLICWLQHCQAGSQCGPWAELTLILACPLARLLLVGCRLGACIPSGASIQKGPAGPLLPR